MREADNSIQLTEKRARFHAQQSTVWTRRQQAVCVRRAYKKYGEKRSPNVILDGLNMTVSKGCIYGLLGASGCGKTTLLSCIVGRRRLNAGEIWVLGGKPGSAGSGVPGPRIGYMPQEVALNKEFTIRESLYYFGWINGMSTKEINPKVDFLINFLMLPSADRYVKVLSGGQQRRVSLACALLHEPELLILDEPTVGVDPVLRQSIWDHLVKITKDGGTTVIITTHYIDETRQAHMIGLMRGGRLLAEESPNDLLQKYNSDSLEDVFLKLSIIQNRGKRRRSSILHDVTAAISVPEIPLQGAVNMAFDTNSEISGEFGETIGPPSISKRKSISISNERQVQTLDLPPDDDIERTLSERLTIFDGNHMKALIWKNFLWMWRNVAIMLFIMGLPVFQIILFCLSIGKDPVGLPMAIVNHEIGTNNPNCTWNSTYLIPQICDDQINSTNPSDCPRPQCMVNNLSCQYLSILRKKKQSLTNYDTVEEAKQAVRKGKAWVVLEFPRNFTAALYKRYDNGREMDLNTLTSSEVHVWLDQSNQQISLLLQRDLNDALNEFSRRLAISCGFDPRLLSPVQFNRPIYGPVVPNFTDFAAPGVMLTIIFFLAVALTSGAMLIERNEGILERSLVSGVTGIEVLLGHVTCQFLIMIIQTIAVIGVTLAFKLTIQGSLLTASILLGLTGLCGMCFGFVVSCVTDSERNATYLALGSFLPIVMLCGIIWPIEGMHVILRVISYFLPLTLSTESLRSIMARGWLIYKPTVYIGFLSTVTWIVVFLGFSIFLIKFKKG
ncbi:ABC transporter G family member 23 isoform X2 [Planococcus citri]